jgi:maleate isomerase
MSFQAIVEQLLADTGASRTTLRLDTPDAVFPVAAEALAPGVNSIANATSIDLRGAPTFQYLDRERSLLIQSDLLEAEVAPPPALIAQYGARAQMLAPIVRDDQMVGILSVHYAPGPRDWTPEDVAALERARDEIVAEL